MASVQVRAADPRDAEDLAQLFNCPGVVAGTLGLPWRSVEHWREQLIQRNPDAHALVAVVNGRMVGILDLHVQRSPRRRHCGQIGMAVHDEYQGQGIGRALMAAMVDLADNWLGLRRIELTVTTDNAAAVRLYQRFGFTIEGTARQFALRNGIYVNAYYMARLPPG